RNVIMPIWPFRSHDPSPFLPSADTSGTKQDEPPKYVDEARFNQALEEVRGMNSKLDQFTGLFTGYMAQPGQQPSVQYPQQPQEQPIDDITDEEYQQAVLQGDAPKISKRMAAVTERKAREIRSEYEQRFRTIETQGLSIYDQLSSEVGQTALKAMPYYQLFRQDIDAALKQVPVHQRTPEMRSFIYERTVGANIDKVKAHDAAEAMRIAKERDQLDPPSRTKEQDEGPTPESVFGDDVI